MGEEKGGKCPYQLVCGDRKSCFSLVLEFGKRCKYNNGGCVVCKRMSQPNSQPLGLGRCVNDVNLCVGIVEGLLGEDYVLSL